MKPKSEKDVAHLMERAAKAFRAGNLKRAESDANSVLKAVPNHPEALYCLGLVRHNQGRPVQAIEHLKRALAQYPDFAPCAVTLSKMLLEAGDGPGAVQVMTDVHAHLPDDANIAFELGRTQIITGNPQAGAEALGRAAELAPEAPPVFGSLGVAYQLMGDEESAHAAYETAIELGSQDPEDFYNLGTVHMNGRRREEAIEAFTRATELNPNHQRAFANIGLLHGRAAEYADAIAPLERALALNPDDGETTNELIYALSVEGCTEQAIEIGEAFLTRHPDAHPFHGQIAFSWMRAGEPEKAIAAADKAISMGVHPIPALAIKSAALNDLGRTSEAGRILDFKRLLQTKVFDTPPGYHSMASFNKDLVQYLLDDPSLGYSKNNRSMEKGKGTLELFNGNEHGPALILKQMIMDMAKEYMDQRPIDPDHPFLAHPPKSFKVNCWGNVYDRDGRQFVHIHPTSWLSGVYYPALPACVKDAAKGKTNNVEGWIEFGRAFHLIGDKNEPAVHLVRPEEGLMVMFPSYFGHQTIPVKSSDEKRISIAFDLEPAEI